MGMEKCVHLWLAVFESYPCMKRCAGQWRFYDLGYILLEPILATLFLIATKA